MTENEEFSTIQDKEETSSSVHDGMSSQSANISQVIENKAAILESKISVIAQRESDDSDLADIRIEGVEETINELHKLIMQLNKKVSILIIG